MSKVIWRSVSVLHHFVSASLQDISFMLSFLLLLLLCAANEITFSLNVLLAFGKDRFCKAKRNSHMYPVYFGFTHRTVWPVFFLSLSLLPPPPRFESFSCYLFLSFGIKQVARPAHKKKARMARTRSDFLTRGAFADWEGDTEEEDCDDSFEFLLSLDQPPDPEPGCAARLGQPCHSDSEMVISIPTPPRKPLCAGSVSWLTLSSTDTSHCCFSNL